MPGAKKSLPAPIDRPLSRAYLRQFLGWSTAYPPGLSQPNSLRIMENILVGRDTGVSIRPGLRHLTWMQDPDLADGELPLIPWTPPGELIGTHEVFFYAPPGEEPPPEDDDPITPIGPGPVVPRGPADKAYLFAAHKNFDSGGPDPIFYDLVCFYVALYTGIEATPFRVVPAEEIFDMDVLSVSFSASTTYVKYVQIDNKIVAMSNAGETIRIFYVGDTPRAVAPPGLPPPVSVPGGGPSIPEVHLPKKTWIDGTQVVSSAALPTPARTADTLAALLPAPNIYNFAVWFTFSNEFGEGPAGNPSLYTAQRPWSGWKQETPNASSEPSGTTTSNPHRAADQLIVIVNEDCYDEQLAAGATHLNVYLGTWASGEPQATEGLLIESKEVTGLDWDHGGWVSIVGGINPNVRTTIFPNSENRHNYSTPSRASQGLVAADRMILVNDPVEPAVIRWTSNLQGDYLNFTANRGGGYKTLTSGNLYITSSVKLWQNPQSVDSLTILCDGVDGMSTGYYMAPAEVTSQSESTSVMGFEETTATPGTVSTYGCEVYNNALFHPIEEQLMKSTAANYAIRHKSLSDLIANEWTALVDKNKIISAEYDGRIYYIVHNPDGATLEFGANGNEVWVLDAQVETPTWNRWLVQGIALRKVEIGGRVMMSVVKPNGIYCFDTAYVQDDFIDDPESGIEIRQKPIPWRLETNTQGANRAHDSWVRLQMLEITLGNFKGRIEWGIRYFTDVNGKAKIIKKTTTDLGDSDILPWNRADFLQIRRDLKEWYFFANSVPVTGEVVEVGYEVEQSSGQINTVQYRYTPNSVNTGYEWGSPDTFEYGRAVATANAGTTTDGVPMPMVDLGRYNPSTDGPDA